MPADRSSDNRRSRSGPRKSGSGGPNKGGRPAGRGSDDRRGSSRRPSGKNASRSRDDREDWQGGARRADRDGRGNRGGEGRDGDREGRRPGPELAGPAGWGRIARGGAGRMDSPAIGDEAFDDLAPKKRRPKPEPEPSEDSVATDDAGDGEAPDAAAATQDEPATPEPKPLPDRPERKLPNADDLARQASKAVSRSRGPKRRDRKPIGARPQRVEDPAVVLKRLVDPARAKSLLRKLNDAGGAFAAERFGDARASLRPVVKEAPDLPDGRELMGLTLYRMGKWREAIDQLEVFREQTHSTEQHPVLMDCHRALERWADVEELWSELGDASPSGELVTEGRIVVAGMHADRGDLGGAIRMLESGWKLPKRPGGHHLRRAYALADAYERAGKAARARELFKWIAGKDPHFSDVRSRVKTLS